MTATCSWRAIHDGGVKDGRSQQVSNYTAEVRGGGWCENGINYVIDNRDEEMLRLKQQSADTHKIPQPEEPVEHTIEALASAIHRTALLSHYI